MNTNNNFNGGQKVVPLENENNSVGMASSSEPSPAEQMLFNQNNSGMNQPSNGQNKNRKDKKAKDIIMYVLMIIIIVIIILLLLKFCADSSGKSILKPGGSHTSNTTNKPTNIQQIPTGSTNPTGQIITEPTTGIIDPSGGGHVIVNPIITPTIPSGRVIIGGAGTTKTLEVGQKGKIPVTQGKVSKWESSDPDVASVDNNGIVTAKKPGTVTITATDPDGNKSSITIVIKNPPAIVIGGAGTTKEIEVGKTERIPVTKGTVTKWESSDPNVATVDNNGNVTGKKPGTTTITATDPDGNKSSITIVIKNPPAVVIGGGSGTTKEIEVGKTEKIPVTQGTVTKWESSDPNVATVDNNGNVTGKNPGTVTITATDPDGNKSTITIVIKNPTTPSKPVVIGGAGTTKEIETGKTEKIPVTQGTVTKWESSDPNVATVDDNGNVTGKNPGTATITATDPDGNKSTITIVIKNPTVQSVYTYSYTKPTSDTQALTIYKDGQVLSASVYVYTDGVIPIVPGVVGPGKTVTITTSNRDLSSGPKLHFAYQSAPNEKIEMTLR